MPDKTTLHAGQFEVKMKKANKQKKENHQVIIEKENNFGFRVSHNNHAKKNSHFQPSCIFKGQSKGPFAAIKFSDTKIHFCLES